jgi:prepilin peptidase CpaA
VGGEELPAIATDVFVLCLVVVCATTDIYKSKIYNAITYPAVGLGIVLAGLTPGEPSIGNSIFGLAIGFIPLFIIFVIGGLGGGDVKLMAAIGAVKGYPFILYAMFYSGLVGGLLAIITMIWGGVFFKSMRNILRTILTSIIPGFKTVPLDPKDSHPIHFGFAICMGTLWALVDQILGIRLL